MLKCWEADATKRMSFKDITEEFGKTAGGCTVETTQNCSH